MRFISMVCLCTAWTRPLFWIWLYASEEVSSKLIQIWAHRSQLASPCAKELQCAYGTCIVFVRSARTNYHSLPRICFYISLLTLFQSNCFLFWWGEQRWTGLLLFCLFSLISMATSVVCLVPFICVKHSLVHFVK